MNNEWQQSSFNHKAAAVIRELGYPDQHALVQWFKEYEVLGDLHQNSKVPHEIKIFRRTEARGYYKNHYCNGKCAWLTI